MATAKKATAKKATAKRPAAKKSAAKKAPAKKAGAKKAPAKKAAAKRPAAKKSAAKKAPAKRAGAKKSAAKKAPAKKAAKKSTAKKSAAPRSRQRKSAGSEKGSEKPAAKKAAKSLLPPARSEGGSGATAAPAAQTTLNRRRLAFRRPASHGTAVAVFRYQAARKVPGFCFRPRGQDRGQEWPAGGHCASLMAAASASARNGASQRSRRMQRCVSSSVWIRVIRPSASASSAHHIAVAAASGADQEVSCV